jgi:retron-type reverse transcriptase
MSVDAGDGAVASTGGWAEFTAWENLVRAWRNAARGKQGSAAVARFAYKPGEHLLRLQRALLQGRWRPGAYTQFALHEAKRRWIAAAPLADRVVHHALIQVVQPRFERTFHAGSHANRTGHGTHRAIDHLHNLVRGHRFVLRLDVQRHFQSIDHAILLRLLARRIPEPELMAVVRSIVASGEGVADPASPDPGWLFSGDDLLALARPRGLPVGNLTSQHWSNVYLHVLDDFCLRTLGARAYVRYVDDFALFHDDKSVLAEWRARIVEFLGRRLRLRVHERSAQVQPCAAGVPWLGWVVYPDKRRLKSRKAVEATRRLQALHDAWVADEISFAEFDASVQSWIEHVRHGDTLGLRKHVLGRFEMAGMPGKSRKFDPEK